MLPLILALFLAWPTQTPTECTTDASCALLCPANEPACDGGPQE
jgi:hypothetical protein